MNRYIGNTGRVIRVEPPPRARPEPPRVTAAPVPARARAPAGKAAEPPSAISRVLGGLSGKLKGLETEDLLLFAVLYLMYRESGDTEPLIILAAMLFL